MKRRRIAAFFVVIALLSVFSVFYPQIQENMNPSGNAVQDDYKKEPTILLRVIDGDTIETEQGNIRLLGINTQKGESS